MVLAGPIFWPLDQAPDVLRRVREYATTAPNELGITVGIAPAPPAPFVPPERFGAPSMGLILAWFGDPTAGADAIQPLRSVGSPFADAVGPMPYVALQQMLDGGAPHGRHYYWKAHRLPELTDDVIDVFVRMMSSPTTPFAQINGWAVGGAVSRVDAEATAVGDRDPGFEMSFTAGWLPTDPDGARHIAWVRDGWEALRPFGEGVYANFISDEGAAGVAYAYGDRLARLQALKGVHDPGNFFRLNNNFAPSGDPRSSRRA
jgi:hypothetical protein